MKSQKVGRVYLIIFLRIFCREVSWVYDERKYYTTRLDGIALLEVLLFSFHNKI